VVPVRKWCDAQRATPKAQNEEAMMIVVRDVFQAKYGKGGDLAALFKESQEK